MIGTQNRAIGARPRWSPASPAA